MLPASLCTNSMLLHSQSEEAFFTVEQHQHASKH
jgi:hypothetical protein